MAMRNISWAEEGMKEFNFLKAFSQIRLGYAKLLKLALAVKMNGEDNEDDDI
jgi:hypothetical protein